MAFDHRPGDLPSRHESELRDFSRVENTIPRQNGSAAILRVLAKRDNSRPTCLAVGARHN
jgi:hypothetical protein